MNIKYHKNLNSKNVFIIYQSLIFGLNGKNLYAENQLKMAYI